MTAVVYDRYGSVDQLRLIETQRPVPAAGQVVVRVAATSINLSDWECLNGSPLYARIGGLRTPAVTTLGSDIAGTVETVGDGVSNFEPGDTVFADNLTHKGGFAEFALIPAKELAPKPVGLTFAQASAIPQAGAIATQATASLEPGMRVLINGGGGGSGSFAIQLAKRAGAHVTGVDNEAKLRFMQSLGANEVIDYRKEDFTSGPQRFDVVIDLVADRSALAYNRALAPGGRYQAVGGSVTSILQLATLGPIIGWSTGRQIGVLGVKQGPTHFAPLADLCESNEVQIYADRTFKLENVPEALAYVGEGHALGKVIIEVP